MFFVRFGRRSCRAAIESLIVAQCLLRFVTDSFPNIRLTCKETRRSTYILDHRTPSGTSEKRCRTVMKLGVINFNYILTEKYENIHGR